MIDRQSGRFMEAYYELTEPNHTGLVSKHTNKSVNGTGTVFQNMSAAGGVKRDTGKDVNCFIPLNFWFCRNRWPCSSTYRTSIPRSKNCIRPYI